MFKVGFVYNAGLALTQVNFFMTGRFLLLDNVDSSFIVFLGLVFSILHLHCIGSGEGENTDKLQAFNKGRLELLDSQLDRILGFLKWLLIISGTCAFYTVMIGYLLILILPEGSIDIATYKTLSVVLYLILAALGAYLRHRHHHVKRH